MIRNENQFYLQDNKTSDEDSNGSDKQFSFYPISLTNSLSSTFSDSSESIILQNTIDPSDYEKIEQENYKNLFTPHKINRSITKKQKDLPGTSNENINETISCISQLSLDSDQVPYRLNYKTINEKDLRINNKVSNLENNTNGTCEILFYDMYHYIPEKNEFVKDINTFNSQKKLNEQSMVITYRDKCDKREFSIIEDFKKSINLQKLGIKLQNMKIVSSNKLIIKTCNSNDYYKMKKYLNSHSILVISKETLPSFYIKKISDDITQANFLYFLVNQNKEKFLESVSRVKFTIVYNMIYTNDEILVKVTHFEKSRRVASVRVSSKIFPFFYKTNLILGDRYINVEPYIHISRCKKCLRLGHSTICCKALEVCTRCFGTSHSKKFCNAPSYGDVCYNCFMQNKLKFTSYNINHKYWINRCPTYLNYLISHVRNWNIPADQQNKIISDLQKKLKLFSY